MKNIIQKFIRAILCVLLSAIIGMLLLDAVYLIPIDKTTVNASTAVFQFVKEKPLNPNSDRYFVQSITDPYSDALMLSNCFVRRADTPFYVAALQGSYLEIGGAKDLNLPYSGFINFFTYGNDNWTVLDYSRYWNGYQVLLIPLLQFFTYPQLRNLSTAVFVILTLAACFCVCKKYSWKYLLSFICAILAVFPFYFHRTFQTVRIFDITMLAVILFCNLKKEKREWLFLFMGIAIAYFDLFSYPFFAPGMLVVLTVIDRKDEKNNKTVLKEIIYYLMFFCIGHLGMWGMKWILTGIIVGPEIFGVVLNRANIHMGSTITLEMGLKNVPYLMSLAWTDYIRILFACTAIAVLVFGLKCGFNGRMWQDAVLYALMALIPFVWCAAIMGHAYWHPFFNFRDFAVSVFAVFSWLVGIPKPKATVNKVEIQQIQQ